MHQDADIFAQSITVTHAFLSMPATAEEELKEFYFTTFGARADDKKKATELFPLAETRSFTCARGQFVFPPLPMCLAKYRYCTGFREQKRSPKRRLRTRTNHRESSQSNVTANDRRYRCTTIDVNGKRAFQSKTEIRDDYSRSRKQIRTHKMLKMSAHVALNTAIDGQTGRKHEKD